MSRRNSRGRSPEKLWEWDKVAIKYQRSVDAEEARARAKILEEIAIKKRAQDQRQLKLAKKGGRP